MPSTADRTQRAKPEAAPKVELSAPDSLGPFGRPILELERYAGWLNRNQPSAAVQASVRALDAAVKAGHESSKLLMLVLTLDHDIKRLPGGAIPKMLRKTLGEIRTALEPNAFLPRAGERS